MEEAYIKYKTKHRPLTSKHRENQYINQPQPRPGTSKSRTNSAMSRDIKTNVIGKDMKYYRLGRPQSALKDNYFNKFWEDSSRSNIIHTTSSRCVPKPRISTPNDQNQIKLEESRKLYNFDKLEWDNKKAFNFLTNIGGLDITRNNFNFIFDANTNVNSTVNTEKYMSRPATGVQLPNELNRPFTAVQGNGNMKKPRIASGLTEIIHEQKIKYYIYHN